LTERTCDEPNTTGETCTEGSPSDVITTSYLSSFDLTVTLVSDPVNLNITNPTYTVAETGKLEDLTRFFYPDYYIRNSMGFPTETFIDDRRTPAIRIWGGSDVGGVFVTSEPATIETLGVGLLALLAITLIQIKRRQPSRD
jgi:hypothetical protein